MIDTRQLLVVALAFASVFAFIFGSYIALSMRASSRRNIESRLQGTKSTQIESQEELVRIRRSRSLTGEGNFLLPLHWLNELLLQSGTKLGLPGLALWASGGSAAVFFGAELGGLELWAGLVLALLAGLLSPIVILKVKRASRVAKFEDQLPDAIDVLVRGLRAGHSLTGAIAAVGRHVPDPVGSEFSLTAAEVTYGLDIETAMMNLRSRVGQADLALVVLAVSVQSKSGGNLTEVLSNLSWIIRQRGKLRRKAQALAAEGRFSAIMLSVMPVVLFAFLWVIVPHFYGDMLDRPYVKHILWGSVAWMLFGDYVMYRMVKLKV